MRLSFVAFALLVSLGSFLAADTITLKNGKVVTGKVTGYANTSFEVATGTGGSSMKYPAAQIQKLEFEARPYPVTIATNNRGDIEAKLVIFEGGQFTIVSGKDTQQLPAMFVNAIAFGGGSAEPVKTITKGSAVDISKHIVKGQITIVDYYADWCGPCKAIGPHLEKMAKEDPDVVLRKVDIVNWGSPVAKQYKINSIPYIEVYGRDGSLLGKVPGASLQLVQDFVAKGKSAK